MSETTLARRAWRRVVRAAGLAFYPHEIDAILSSYPKSGRTWFRFMLSSYLAAAFDLKHAPDLHTMFRVVPNLDMDTARGLPAFAFARHAPRPPLVAATHLPHSRLRFRNTPAIVIVRDPRDVMVSAYFHATRQKRRFSGDIDAFLRDPEQGITALTSYLNDWATGLRHRRSIVVSYEALSRDPRGESARALAFLGLTVEPQMLARAVDAASFGNMQALEQASGLPGHDYDLSDNESLRMRRGKVGGFADYLTAGQIAFIDAACDAALTPQAKLLLGPDHHTRAAAH